MTNLLVGDNQVVVVDVDQGVLERSDLSGTHLNGFLVKIRYKTCINVKLTLMTNSLVGDHQVAVVDFGEGVLEGSDLSGTHLNGFLVKISYKTCIIC